MTDYFTEAMDCAHSDSCPIEEAEAYAMRLNEIRNEKESFANMCDEILGELRSKVQAVSETREVRVSNSGAAAVSADMVADALTVGILVAAAVWMYPAVTSSSPSFSFQEWMYAYNGGYMDEMIGHYMRNGGL
jgi:hypothetical protein